MKGSVDGVVGSTIEVHNAVDSKVAQAMDEIRSMMATMTNG